MCASYKREFALSEGKRPVGSRKAQENSQKRLKEHPGSGEALADVSFLEITGEPIQRQGLKPRYKGHWEALRKESIGLVHMRLIEEEEGREEA